MQELYKAQSELFKIQPENYGLLTSVIMHLIRNIPFSIRPHQKYLQDTLRDLNYGPTAERFGMFFLHDLRLDRGRLSTIPKQDTEEVQNAMGARKRRKIMPLRTNTERTNFYPLGERPTWIEVQDCLKYNPNLLVKPFSWILEWDNEPYTSEILIQFTVDFWLTLDQKLFSKPIPKITTLRQAMEMWSVREITNHVLNVKFLPNAYGICQRKASSWSFKDLGSVYFPDPDAPVAPKSGWDCFRQQGYLGRLGELKEILSEENFDHLTSNIYFLIGKLQCLPYSIASDGEKKGRLWKTRLGTIEMLTNPEHYKLHGIGQSQRPTRTVIRAIAHPTEISARLGEAHQGIPARSFKKKKYREARSARSRNKRKPPTR